tara:strand:+ start:132 stop:242 length:111 start_codon:yes stop_codon:yes gene_type:complete
MSSKFDGSSGSATGVDDWKQVRAGDYPALLRLKIID